MRKVLRRTPGVRSITRRVEAMAKHRRAERLLDRFLEKELAGFIDDIDPGPIPPNELIATTSLLTKDRMASASDPASYYFNGRLVVWQMLSLLKKSSFNIRTATSIMEFGCGTSQKIRHLRRINGVQLTGTDVIAKSVEWCKNHIEGISFHLNELDPPLTFAKDDTFDLIFALSVFTHIPLDAQRVWLEELRRVMRPGGYFYCTLLGSRHVRVMLNADQRTKLAEEGEFTLNADDPEASYSTQVAGSWDVFQTRSEVLRRFGEVFEVVDYVSAESVSMNQDIIIVRKPA